MNILKIIYKVSYIVPIAYWIINFFLVKEITLIDNQSYSVIDILVYGISGLLVISIAIVNLFNRAFYKEPFINPTEFTFELYQYHFELWNFDKVIALILCCTGFILYSDSIILYPENYPLYFYIFSVIFLGVSLCRIL